MNGKRVKQINRAARMVSSTDKGFRKVRKLFKKAYKRGQQASRLS